MTNVKARNRPRMVVVPHNPQRKVFLVGFVLLAVVAGYLAGYYFSNKESFSVKGDSEELMARFSELKELSQNQQRKLAQYEIEATVDKRATNDVREGMAALRKEVSDLKSKISFYKGLMSPASESKGLSIRSLDLVATNEPRKYGFKMVLQQLADEHKLLAGEVKVTIIGRMDDREIIFSLSDLSETVTEADIKFRFKYFQNIEGDLVLPIGYEPQQIEVEVRTGGSKPQTLEQKFGWITQEV